MKLTPEVLQQTIGEPGNDFYTSDMRPSEAAMLSLRRSLVKKFVPVGREAKAAEVAAIELFFRMNSRTWERDTTSYYDDDLVEMREELFRFFWSTDQCEWLTLNNIVGASLPGPGASLGTKSTSFVEKMFDSKLTVTDLSLHAFYLASLSPSWRDAENIRYSRCGGVEAVVGSKLAVVPKDRKIGRCICTEPSLNMFFQKGAGNAITQKLRSRYGISIDSHPGQRPQPELNAELARIGSVNGDFATIDLKSASDCISTELVRFLLPRTTFWTLDFLRSKRFTWDGEVHEFGMFSSMGNGFTFPLMTTLFAAAIRVVYRRLGIPLKRSDGSNNWGVFGDDIVCVKNAYDSVVHFLSYLGFIVNTDKSFAVGPFRESCGKDFFLGHDIRGVYIKDLSNDLARYSCFNRLVRWSVRMGPDITDLLRLVGNRLRFRPIPFDESDAAGVKVPYDMLRSPKLDRNGAVYYHALTVKPNLHNVKDLCETNPAAHLIGAVGGYITQGHRVSIRVNEPITQVIKRKTPCWDYLLGPVERRDYAVLLGEVVAGL